MVEVVALAVTLHDIGGLLVVDVTDGVAGVGAHALAVQPGGVGASDRVFGERPQHLHGHSGRGDTGPVAEDAAPGCVGEHSVAERVDEVRLRGGFAEGGDHVTAARVEEGGDGATNGKGGALDAGQGHMARVVWRWAGED